MIRSGGGIKKILVTGGAGYIGSHVAEALLDTKRYSVTVFDNLQKGHPSAIPKGCTFIKGDIRNKEDLQFLAEEKFEAVIHLAGLAHVEESYQMPDVYWDVNVAGTLNVLDMMLKSSCSTFILSSSCSVYGDQDKSIYTEDSSVIPISPYASTKASAESAMRDYTLYGLRGISLRYFNAAGASFTGLRGEIDTKRLIPKTIMSTISYGTPLEVYGDDYDTPDGTCIRDYTHVVDIADAHVKALEYAFGESDLGFDIFNIGTGKGSSIMEVIKEVEKITQDKVPHEILSSRAGDPTKAVADFEKAYQTMNWAPRYGLRDIISTSLAWLSDPKY